MAKDALSKFRHQVKLYRKAHPSASYRGAQKAVKRQGGKARVGAKKRNPHKRKKVVKKRTTVSRPRRSSTVKRTVTRTVAIGSVHSHLSLARKAAYHEYEKLQGQLLKAKTKPAKRKIQKKISKKRALIRRLES